MVFIDGEDAETRAQRDTEFETSATDVLADLLETVQDLQPKQIAAIIINERG